MVPNLDPVPGVSKNDSDSVHIEGIIEEVQGCVDLEDPAGYVRPEHSLVFTMAFA